MSTMRAVTLSHAGGPEVLEVSELELPVRGVPECRWVERDEDEIHRLVGLADELLAMMRAKLAPR